MFGQSSRASLDSPCRGWLRAAARRQRRLGDEPSKRALHRANVKANGWGLHVKKRNSLAWRTAWTGAGWAWDGTRL